MNDKGGTMNKSEFLNNIANNESLLEVARKAIEDELIAYRDVCLSQPLRGNGLVVRSKDGEPSSLVRFGPETAMEIGLRAIAKAIEGGT